MHIITGEIRKEPRVKQTQNGTLYVVELSERYKDREGNAQYTNYTFFFNARAGSEGMKNWYDEAFQVGKVISVSCEVLKAELREYEGKTYVTMQAADFPKLLFSQRGAGQAPQQSQPRQQAQQSQPRQNNEPPIDFDDDIPF